jgi:beta-glucosidase
MNRAAQTQIRRCLPNHIIRWFCFVACGLGFADRLAAQTWTNASLTASQRATALLDVMTQAEKIAMVSGAGGPYIGNISGNKRLGIPALGFQDGPGGAGDWNTGVTAFPAPICIAASWDEVLMRQYGTYIGEEERGKGGQVLLGPTMNMARAYQNGRNFESYGEDPYLASVMAAAHVQGIQSQGVIATAKHFVCNDEETDRWLVSADADERTRQEIYYPPFRAAVDAGVGAIMASYNRVNGRSACESAALNATVKKLWGYDGFIMSDWDAYFSTVAAANNGLDMDMYNRAFGSDPLAAAIQAGNVPSADLDGMVHRILTTMFRLGDFDHPTTGKMSATVTSSAHAQFARDAAAAGTVLLQNKNLLLPLNTRSIKSIAVIGSVAGTKPISSGLGSGSVPLPYDITPLAGISQRAGAGITVNYSEGDGNIPAAVSLARTSDIVIVCVGERTGESRDRTSLSLPGDQDALVSAVAAVNTNTIVVVYCSSATLLPWSANVAAALVAWYPGQENGHALAKILFGDVNPSGKLPVTFPATASEVPANTPAQFPGVNGHVVYSEGLEIGYRWYDANNITPRFPFGHGLSYTTFGYTNLTVSTVSPAGQVQVGFDLMNTGARAGAEVAQLYLGFPVAAGEPPKLLKGFKKIFLQPGQAQHMTFNLDWQDLANWDATARGWLVTPGTFQVMVGASSRDLRLTGSFTVESVPSSDLANAALHQAVTASSTLNAECPAAAAVDGNPASAWNSLPGNPQWFAVDLGVIKNLSRVRLQWGTNFAVRYALEISTDAKHWQTIFKTKHGAGGVEDLLVSNPARYVRMQATRSSWPGAGYSLNEFEVYSQPQKPFGGSVPILPGRIEAENFDTGGENVAYHKSTAGNPGGVYRTNDDVGIEPATDTGGGYIVAWINTGDWLEYTVNVPDPSAIYRVSVRVASPNGGGKLRGRLDGTVLGTVTVPKTGGWQNWQTVALPNVPIAGGIGSRALRLEVLEGGFNLNWIQLDRVQVCGTNNIALNQPAFASSVESTNVAAAAAFDGDPRSHWASQREAAQWLSVDLGSVQNIARIRLDWQSGDWKDSGYGHAAYSRSYSVQFSTDGNTWTNAYATTNGIGGVNDLAVSGRARYVRMNSTQPVNTNGVSLYEFEIYAPVSSDPTQSK